LLHSSLSSSIAWKNVPWCEATCAALIAPADTPVMQGMRNSGNRRATHLKNPT